MVEINRSDSASVNRAGAEAGADPTPAKDEAVKPTQLPRSDLIGRLMGEVTEGAAKASSFQAYASPASPQGDGPSAAGEPPRNTPSVRPGSLSLRRLGGELTPAVSADSARGRELRPATPAKQTVPPNELLETFGFSPAEISLVDRYGGSAQLAEIWPLIANQNRIHGDCSHALVMHLLKREGVTGLEQLHEMVSGGAGMVLLGAEIERIGVDKLRQSRPTQPQEKSE